jgi:isopenicillin N synthase-like dioxygenase
MSSNGGNCHNLIRFGSMAAVTVGVLLAGYFAIQAFTTDDKKKITQREAPSTRGEPNTLILPVIDFTVFNNRDKNPDAYKRECEKVADAFHRYGVVIVRDPRVSESDNHRFLNMMEKYFESSDGVRDARPEIGYQIGVTGEGIERARNHCTRVGAYGPDDKPLSPCPPEFDKKWRFFWRVGPQPQKTEFPQMNADPVIPPEFPEWKDTMDMWGGKMINAVYTLAEMAAVGFNMPPDAFTSRMQMAPHLLAPTGSDFNKFNTQGHILAGYHYDLNFMTIHGKSRFPGLYLWTRDGKKMTVNIPDGCLLVQAGKQYEYLTGGHVLAGFHEVVITPATLNVIKRRKDAGESLWRVSSTLFSHVASDQVLEPLAPFNSPDAVQTFPPIKAGNQVKAELEAISLLK